MHLLIDIEAGRNVQNLVQFQDLDHTGPLPIIRLNELPVIKRLAHEDVKNFGLTRLAVFHDLGVVDVELGFAVVPITGVLDKGGSELSKRGQCPRNRKGDQSKERLLHGAL